MVKGNLNKEEQDFYKVLMNQCANVCGPGPCDAGLFAAVVKRCEIMLLIPSIGKKYTPEETAIILNSLIAKGYVKEITSNQFPAFVPKEYWLKGAFKSYIN